MKWLLWTSIYERNIFEIIVYELIHLWIVTLRNQVYGTIGYEPDFMKWLYPVLTLGRLRGLDVSFEIHVATQTPAHTNSEAFVWARN